VPSTIKTICTGVVLVAVAAIRSAGGGSTLNGSTRGAAAAIESFLVAMGRVIVAASIKVRKMSKGGFHRRRAVNAPFSMRSLFDGDIVFDIGRALDFPGEITGPAFLVLRIDKAA
jgi:hypothetical protein